MERAILVDDRWHILALEPSWLGKRVRARGDIYYRPMGDSDGNEVKADPAEGGVPVLTVRGRPILVNDG